MTTLVALAAAQFALGQADTRIPAAPGELVDVGGYQLHYYCTGEGSPTVLLDAGLGDWSLQMRPLQDEVSRFTRVCTFDRAGYGWSEAGPEPRESGQIVSELKSLIDGAGLEGPFVLAGHSFGGLNSILFANQYPELVAGVVLIDSSHPDQTARLAAVPEMAAMEAGAQAQFDAMVAAARQGQLTVEGVLPLAPAVLPADLRETWARSFIRLQHLSTAVAELGAIEQSSAQVRAGGTLGDISLTVIARGKPLAEQMPPEVQAQAGLTPEILDSYDSIWRALQEDHLNRSSDSRLVVAEESPHYVHATQPELVVSAIRELVQRR